MITSCRSREFVLLLPARTKNLAQSYATLNSFISFSSLGDVVASFAILDAWFRRLAALCGISRPVSNAHRSLGTRATSCRCRFRRTCERSFRVLAMPLPRQVSRRACNANRERRAQRVSHNRACFHDICDPRPTQLRSITLIHNTRWKLHVQCATVHCLFITHHHCAFSLSLSQTTVVGHPRRHVQANFPRTRVGYQRRYCKFLSHQIVVYTTLHTRKPVYTCLGVFAIATND